MFKSIKLIVWALALFTLTSCGALFNSSPKQIPVNSDPPGAEIYVDGFPMGSTPTTLSLKKNKDYRVEIRKEGFKTQYYTINSKVSGGFVILDILGGIIPVVVDAATGAWKVLDTDQISVQLIKEE